MIDVTDPITDMLNRIKNAQAVNHPRVFIPFSKIKFEILEILQKEGYIETIEKRGRLTKKVIKVTLKYTDEAPALSRFKRISKPGQRIYVPKDKIPSVKQGMGIAIISTSKGLMTGKEARKKGLGGEVIAEIW